MIEIKKLLREFGIDDRWCIEDDNILVGEYTDCDDMKGSEEHAYNQIDFVREDLENLGYTIRTDHIEHDYVGYCLEPIKE